MKEEKERERDDNLSFIFPLLQRAFEQERQTREKEERLILSAWYNLVSNTHTPCTVHMHFVYQPLLGPTAIA